MSLAGWNIGVWLVPVMISDSERLRQRRRVAAQIIDWEKTRKRTRYKGRKRKGRWGLGRKEREGEKARLSDGLSER